MVPIEAWLSANQMMVRRIMGHLYGTYELQNYTDQALCYRTDRNVWNLPT